MQGLTRRQEEVVEFIQRHVRRHGCGPTYREIARHIRRDVRAAYQHVRALERKGVLERSGGLGEKGEAEFGCTGVRQLEGYPYQVSFAEIN